MVVGRYWNLFAQFGFAHRERKPIKHLRLIVSQLIGNDQKAEGLDSLENSMYLYPKCDQPCMFKGRC